LARLVAGDVHVMLVVGVVEGREGTWGPAPTERAPSPPAIRGPTRLGGHGVSEHLVHFEMTPEKRDPQTGRRDA
jgi:hypothetical protein